MKCKFPWFFILTLLFLVSVLNAQTITTLKQKLRQTGITLKESAKIESDIGRLYFAEGDFVTAQKYFFASLNKADKIKNQHLIASACNNISATYMETENYPSALEYAKKAIAINKVLNDHKGLADAYNSLGNAYYMQENDEQSLYYFAASVKEREIIKDSVGLFAGYKNLGSNYYEIGKIDEARRNIDKSLQYLTQKKDTARWFGAYLTLGQMSLFSKDYSKAKSYLDLCKPYVSTFKMYDKIEDYYYTLSLYYEETGNMGKALSSHKQYTKFRDSVVSLSKNKQLSELNIQYQSEKKQSQINRQRFEIEQKNNWLIFSGILFLTTLLMAYFVYKNYKSRQDKKLQGEIFRQQEIESKALFDGEQKERIRIARDLHDGVGQMLSLIKMNLSMADSPVPAMHKIGDLVDKTIEEVRNVSHNLIPQELNFGIVRALEDVAEKVNASGTTKMFLSIPDDIRDLTFEKQNELSIYRIVQEVVNNMIKHAGANRIDLSINKIGRSIIIAIKDNGRGMNEDAIGRSKGLGWKNINARVHMLDGKINITSEKLSGTQIEITLPQHGE